MGKSWQSDDHKSFIIKHLTLYDRKNEEEKLKEFWPMILEEWFKRWPLSEPPEKLVTKEGTIEKARKAWKHSRTEVSIAS